MTTKPIREITGSPSGAGRRFGIVVSRFNEPITSKLLAGALDAFARHGVDAERIDVAWVPGAFELPIAVRRLLATERYDAVVAVGAVVRGETPHFEYVSAEASRGLAQAGIDFDRPVGFGLLTCDTMEQAEARAGGTHGNKGWDAAMAALEMIDVLDRVESDET